MKLDAYSTHQPVLYEAISRTTGPVIEFGCGPGSTPLLHQYCADHDRDLLTLESDLEWYGMFIKYATPKHRLIYVSDWSTVLVGGMLTILADEMLIAVPWDVAFIDQAPFEARYATILALKDVAKFIVLHDCDYFPEHGIFGKNVRGLNGAQDRGLRTYDDTFRYYKEFFPPEPWPYARTGPPTLLASNFESCDWDIDFESYDYHIREIT